MSIMNAIVRYGYVPFMLLGLNGVAIGLISAGYPYWSLAFVLLVAIGTAFLAERMIPAADLSEQISTAGKEASGTGNMKFALNGALTIGTLDGANVEIRDHVGAENFFLFGLTASEVAERRMVPDYARAAIDASPRLTRVLGQIFDGRFSPRDPGRYHGLIGTLYDHDYFLVTCDFDAYYAAQRDVDAAFADRDHWAAMAVRNTGSMGWFSSDRTIKGYARDIWNVPVGGATELDATG